MTLNGVALILRFSPNAIALLANYVTVVEVRPIMLLHRPVASPLFGLGRFYEIVDPGQARSQTFTRWYVCCMWSKRPIRW